MATSSLLTVDPPVLYCDHYFCPGHKKRARHSADVIRNAELQARAGFLVQFAKGPLVQPSMRCKQLLIDLILFARTLLDYGRRTSGVSCVSGPNAAEGNPGTAGDGIRIRTRSTV